MKTKATAQTESFDAGEILVSVTVTVVILDALLLLAWVLR